MAPSSLPIDIVEEIISKAPIESLLRCKPISKQWYALCKDKRFIYKYLDLSKERMMRIYHDKVEIINPVTLDLLCLPVPAEFNRVAFPNNIPVIHCNGLLLCRWFTGKGPWYNNVAVWNPVLGQLKVVDSGPHNEPKIYGFGYDNVSRDSYKIVKVYLLKRKEFEIYDFKSKLWRGAFSDTLDWDVYTHKLNVSMNGNMYWIAETKVSGKWETFIQSFDFSKETFKPIWSFPFENSVGVDSVGFSGFRGDMLSLFRQRVEDKTREMEVWITNKVSDVVVSWSKYFSVTSPDLPILNPRSFQRIHVPTFFIHKTNSFMLWFDEVVGEGYVCTSFYDIGQGEINKQVDTRHPSRDKSGRNPCLSSFVYVPSLVPVLE